MGPFTYNSPDAPATVLARLCAEGRRRRPADLPSEVRAVGTGVAVRVDGRRFRLWVHTVGRAAQPVAEGEVSGSAAGSRLAGRVRHARPMLAWLAIWSGWVVGVGAFAGAGWFWLWLGLVWAGGLASSLMYKRALQEEALHAVLARCAGPGGAPAPPPNVALQATRYAGQAAAPPPSVSPAGSGSPAAPRA